MNIPILMYHKIQEPQPGNDLAVSRAAFARQMAYLHKQGYRPIALSTLAAAGQDPSGLPKRPVVITFDDAYQSVYSEARPILQEQGFTATVFVVAEALGQHNFWDVGKDVAQETCMPGNELMALADQGWEIGSHGATHANLAEVTEETLITETEGSRRMLEQELKTKVEVFCYPFGAWNEKARIAVQTAGYQAACAISPGTESVTADIFALRRVYVKPSDTPADFKRKISSWYLWYRARRKR